MKQFAKKLSVALAAILTVTMIGLVPATSASAETFNQQDIRNGTNDYRHMMGLPMVENNEKLNDVAQAWAESMAKSRVLQHNPDVAKQIPGGFNYWGENVATGYPTPVDSVDGWWFSPGHRANMLLEDATDIGSGYALDKNGVSWAVEIIVKYPKNAVPSAPTGLTTATTNTSVTATWKAPTNSLGSSVNQYEVTLQPESGNPTILYTSGTSQTFSNLTAPNANYTIVVRAKNATGWGPLTSAVSVTLTGVPPTTPPTTTPPTTTPPTTTPPTTTPPTTTPPTTEWKPSVSRISGVDRYEASANISKAGHPNGAKVVYVATGTNFPDALSVAPVAGNTDSPLLLTMSDQVPPAVATEIARLKPTSIVVLGGTNSVTDGVMSFLQKIAPTTRVSGVDRYDASGNFVINSFKQNSSSVVYVATGANFPDALSASASAAYKAAPVILVNGNGQVEDRTKQIIQYVGAKKIIIIGGLNSVSPVVANQLNSISGVTSVVRIAGDSRFDSSNNINKETFTTSVDTVYLATGYNFPDALSGAALAGSKGAPLFVVHQDCVPADILTTMKSLNAKNVVLLGGENSLNSDVASLKSCG